MTTSTTPHYQREFPRATLPVAIAAALATGELIDLSYHHDVCPSFGHRDAPIDNGEVHDLRLYVHPELPDDREGDYPRFNVYLGGAHEAVLVNTDDHAAALACLRTAARVLWSLRKNGHIE